MDLPKYNISAKRAVRLRGIEKGYLRRRYIYQPLHPLVDTLRLIILEPSEDFDAPVRGSLVEVKFSNVPKYDALSYRWGRGAKEKQVLIGDMLCIYVGENLYEALKTLRNRPDALPLWADALSINQQDIPERNRQVRLMPHIYFRARTVLIWLGSQSVMRQGQSWAESQETTTHTPEPAVQLKDILHAALCLDPYWDRVWIIQEIGKARNLKVCFDEISLPWSDFILKIKNDSPNHAITNYGPLRINEQLKTKYGRGHTLVNLLESYKESKCEDPRDKIYGFIGLASDCHGFPIDYTKSIYEVWKDTILFINQHGPENVDPVSVGQLVARLLGCKQSLILESRVPSEEPSNPGSYDKAHKAVVAIDLIKLKVFEIGSVIHLGPSPKTLIAELSAVDKWAESIYRNFKSSLGSAFEENDQFMQVLEEIDLPELEKANVNEDATSEPQSSDDQDLTYNKVSKILLKVQNLMTDAPSNIGNLSAQKLFQLKHSNDARSTIYGRMGICCDQARAGDLVCWVFGMDRSLIIRNLPSYAPSDPHHEVIGTAVLSSDLFQVPVPTITEDEQDTLGEILEISVDAKSLFDMIT